MAAPSAIQHIYNNVLILQRGDGYWNATAMCRANGKQWSHYWENDSSQEYADELAGSLGIPRDRLVRTIMTGPNELRGTWVHQRIALHLAQWCNPRFAVRVTGWVEELLTQGCVELAPRRQTLRPYSDRVMLMPSVRRQVPEGHWCVFIEAADLLIWAELIFVPAQLEMQACDLLDGSVGTRWKQFREGKQWAGERVQYTHCFPPDDIRGEQLAWAYPMAELPHFREWLHREYVPVWFPDYLQRKYGPPRLLAAAPELRRLGLNLPANVLGHN